MFRFLFAILLFTVQVAAADLNVIDVRRNIPLSDDEPVYKDFYINGGEAEGLKKDLVVTVIRQLHIRDASGVQTYGEISVPVGQLRILAVYGKVSVAREYKIHSRDEHPMLEQLAIMSGDQIELKGSFVDNKSKRKPQATAATPKPVPQMPPAAKPVISSEINSLPEALLEPEIPAPSAAVVQTPGTLQ